MPNTYVQMPDGAYIQFPEGTKPEVMKAAGQKYIAQQQPPPKPSRLDTAVKFGKDAVKGVGEGIGNTALGIGDMASKIPGIGPKIAPSPEMREKLVNMTKPEGATQKVFKNAEQIGEWLLPTGELKGMGLAGKMAAEGVKGAALNKAQGGSATAGAMMGAAGPVLSKGMEKALVTARDVYAARLAKMEPEAQQAAADFYKKALDFRARLMMNKSRMKVGEWKKVNGMAKAVHPETVASVVGKPNTGRQLAVDQVLDKYGVHGAEELRATAEKTNFAANKAKALRKSVADAPKDQPFILSKGAIPHRVTPPVVLGTLGYGMGGIPGAVAGSAAGAALTNPAVGAAVGNAMKSPAGIKAVEGGVLNLANRPNRNSKEAIFGHE